MVVEADAEAPAAPLRPTAAQVGYTPAVDVSDRRLILVVGKGGVGRSTVAAAIASECAARGSKTLLFETNANDRFGTLLR